MTLKEGDLVRSIKITDAFSLGFKNSLLRILPTDTPIQVQNDI